MPASTRRRYTEALKREAVRVVCASAHPVAPVARDLGISDHVVSRGTAQHRQAAAHGTTRATQRAEAEALTRVKREPLAGWLHNSDRGSQYAARRDQRLLGEHGITSRLSRTDHGWDKAGVDSCVGTLKRALVSHRRDATRHDATQDIFEYIEVFSNRRRRHSTLGYDSPAEFEVRTAVA